MFPPVQRPPLNVPLPDPSAILPPQPQPDPVQRSLSLIAPLFALGSMFGGSPRAGAALLQGTHAGLAQREQERASQQADAERLALAQQQLAARAAEQEAVREAQRQAGIQKLIETTHANLKGVTNKDEYNAQIQFAENIGQNFYGLRPNVLRQAVPYRAPDARQNLYDAVHKYLTNPTNKEAIDQGGAMRAAIQVDTDGDGTPDRAIPLSQAIEESGYPVFLDPETKKPMLTGKPVKPENVQDFDLVYGGLVEKWKSEKGRPPTDEERGKMALQARKLLKDATATPPINVNIPGLQGMTPADRVNSAADDIIAHRMAPSQLATFFTGMGKESASQLRSLVMQRVKQIQPEFNFAEAESNFQFGKATGTQNTIRFLDNIDKTLPRLRAASGDLKRGGVRLINGALLASKRQFGNTQVATFDTDRLILSDEIAKVLQGGGTGSGTSDAKLKQAGDLLRGDMSIRQFDATLNEVEELLKARRATLSKGTFMQQDQDASPDVVYVFDAKGNLVPKKMGGG